MTNGKTRATIKTSAESVGKGIQEVGKGIQDLTVGIGRGIRDFTHGTVDAIFNPHTIPEKLESAFDIVALQPTRRTIEFIQGSTQTLVSESDNAFQKRIKEARKGAHRLKVVFAKPLHDIGLGSFVAKNYPKSDEDKNLIEMALKDNFVFAHLTSSKRMSLINAFEPVVVKKGTEIIKEGDVGDFFYIIGEGNVNFRVGGNDVGAAGTGQTFGDLALLYQAPRAATCIAKTECGLFRLDQETFRRLLARQIEDQQEDVLKILRQVPYFKDLDEVYLNKIACNLKISNFEDGEYLVQRGQSVKKFFIIKEGTVRFTDIDAGEAVYNDLTVGAGQFFGDAAIVDDAPAYGTVKALGPVLALNLSRETFTRILGDDMGKLVQRTKDKRKLVNNWNSVDF